MEKILSKRVLSVLLSVLLIVASIPLSQLSISAVPAVTEYTFSPLKVAKSGTTDCKYASTTENPDGSLSIGVISSSSRTNSYFEPALKNGNPFSFKENTYYKISFDYKVTSMTGNYVRIAPARVASERFTSSFGVSVYTDQNKVARIENNTTFKEANNPADFAENETVTAAQTNFESYSITVKSPESFSHASGTTYDDLIFNIISDNKDYSVTFKNLVILECEELPDVELINGDGSVYSTIKGFPSDTFTVPDLPKLAPSQRYYIDEDRTVEFVSGVYGTTEKVYITKTPYNLYYSEKVDVVNPFNNDAASRDSDGNLVMNNTGLHSSIFQPSFAGSGFKLKASTHYSLTFKYKVTKNDDTYLNIYPFRFSMARVNAGGTILQNATIDPNTNRRITDKESVSTNYEVMSKHPETIKVEGINEDFVTYTYNFTTPDSLYFSTVKYDYDDLFIAIRNGSKTTAKKFTVVFKDFEIREANTVSEVELVNGDGTIYSTVNGFPGDTFTVADLPKLAPSQKYYVDEERTVEFVSGVYGTTEKVYITKTPYNLYYSEKVDVVNPFNDNVISRDADGNLVIGNTGLHSSIFQPSFAGSGFKLKASTHYSLTFKYKVTKNDDTYLNIYPFRFSMARVNTGGTNLQNAASDPNTNRRITAKESVSTNYEVMSKYPETIKVEGINEDFVTYTYNFTTPDSLYFSTVKYDYDDLFIAIRNGSKTTAKKFTVVFKDFEIREANTNSPKVEIYSGATLEQTLIGFPDEVINLPALSPMYKYYTNKAGTSEFVTGAVFGEGTTKVYKKQTPELFIENFNFPPYTNSEFMVGSGINSTLYKHFRYSVPEDGSTLNYQVYYKNTATTNNEGTVGSVLGRTGDTYAPVGVMTEATSFFTLKPGKTYVIEFDYNVESLDASGGGVGESYTGDNYIKFGIARSHNSENGKEQRAVSMAQTLAGAGEPAYNIATIKETGSGHIVKSFTVYDWLNESFSVDTTAWDGLSILMSGYGKASIDNIRVVPMEETDKTLITFNLNGGKDVCEGNAVIVEDVKTYTLPTPTRAGYIFKGWYTNAGLTKKFNASKYTRTDGILALYAKWQGANEVLEGIEISDFMNNAPYTGIMTGTSNYTVASLRYQAVADSENGYLRYKYAYEDGKGSLVSNVGGELVDINNQKFNKNGFGLRGDHKGAQSTNAAVMLALPDNTSSSGYSPVTVEVGKYYYITYDYFAKSLDTVNPYSGNNNISIGIGRVIDSSNTKYYVDSQNTNGTTASLITETSSEWQTGSYVFTPYDSSSMSDEYIVNKTSYNLALMISGYGEVYIDNIRIYAMEDNKNYSVLNFESNGGSKCDDMILKNGSKPTLPTPTKDDFYFGGWYTDKEFTNKFDAASYKRTTGVVRLYAKWLGVETYKIDFENPRMYYTNNEFVTRNIGRAYHRYDFVTDPTNSSNKVLKYQYNYAEAKEDVFGSAKGPSGSALAGAVLYNPETLSPLILTEGDVIKVSFKYKVVNVEKDNVSIDLRTTNPNNSSHLAVSQEPSLYNENTTTAWKTIEVSTQITNIKSDEKYIANALAIGMSGYGTVLVDDIIVTRYTGYAVGFNTKTDEKIMPIKGKPGGTVLLPTVFKQGCIFAGWYTDPDYKNKYEGSVYKFNEKPEMLYAKFKACQIKQDFEDYTPLSMQTWKDFCINIPTSDEYDLDLVHTGDGSVFRRGDMSDTRQTAIFDDKDMPTLEIGETYVFQIWVKPVELFVEGSYLMIRHCAQFDRCYSDQEKWEEFGNKASDYAKIGKGKSWEQVALADDLRVGEWNLVTYEFTAVTPYIAIASPEYNKIAYDDCTITLKGAEGYTLDVDNTIHDEETTQKVDKKVIRTDPNHIFEKTISGVGRVIVAVVAGSTVIIAAGVLLIIFRKKIFKKKINQ